MKNRKIILGIVALSAVAILTTGCGQKAELENGSEVVVKLDGVKITADEYYNEIKTTNVSTLVDMIDHELFDEKYGGTEEEDEEVEGQIKTLKSYYGDDEDTYKSVLLQYFGANDEEKLDEILRLEYRRNQAVNDYVDSTIKDDEIKKYYKNEVYGQVSASHILIMPSVSEDATTDETETAEEEALNLAKKIIKKLKNGEKFEDLAKEYSDDDSNAENGGDLGYFDYDDMFDEFSDALKELDIDEYTVEPVKTSYGYHIILKTGEKEKPELDEVKDEIIETLRNQKLDKDATLYYTALMEIREESGITWKDDKIKKQYNQLMDQLIEYATSSTEE